MQANQSDVARFREEQALHEQAAQHGLSGPRVAASHEIITARMQRSGEHILQLVAQGRDKEAQALMESDWWTQDQSEPLAPCEA